MKMRNKGKVYPSPSSSSSSPISSSPTANRDALSILKLLPAAILALVSVLSLEDKEVLAYMITGSLKSSNPSSIVEEKKKSNKKPNTHKPPVFDCECFECYTSYWFRWDSSPNRELIHQAIEAFEEHLASGEQAKRHSRGKKREKMGRRGAGKAPPEREADVPDVDDSFVGVLLPENEGPVVELPEEAEGMAGDGGGEVVDEGSVGSVEEEVEPSEAAAAAVVRCSSENNHKGLVRKVLPDVVGLLNSRLWGLWSPNV